MDCGERSADGKRLQKQRLAAGHDLGGGDAHGRDDAQDGARED